MRIIKKGATSQSLYFILLDSTSTSGGRKTGLVYNTSGLKAYYTRNGGTPTAITLATLAAANSAWSSGGFKETDATNRPGEYRLDVPDAAFASGVDSVTVGISGATGLVSADQEVQLVAYDPQDAVRQGMTAFPAVASGSAGSLPTTGTGANQINLTGGRADADVLRWNGTAVASPNTAGVPVVDTRRVVRQGTAQATGNSTTAIKLDSGASATTDYYKGMLVQFISGTGAPAAAICTAYDGTTKIATLAPAVPTAADNTTVFQIFPCMVDVETWKGSAPNALQSGRVDSYLGAVASSVIAAGSFAANALDAVWSTAARTLTAFSFSVTVGTNNDKTGYGLSAAAVQAVWDAATSALTTVGSIGKRIADYLTGDAYVRLGAPAGASVSADVAAIKTDTGNLVSRITSTLFSGITQLSHWLGAIMGKQSANSTALTEIRASGAGSGTYDPTTDSLEAQMDNSANLRDFGTLNTTSIGSLTSQTVFTLAAGSSDDNAYNSCTLIVTDQTNVDQKAIGFVDSYVGSTKTVTLKFDPGIFVMANGDLVTILPPQVCPGIKKNKPLSSFEFVMIDSTDNKTGKTGLTVTATRSIDGGAFASCANAVTEVANGVYKINLAASDLNGNVITLRFTGTGANDTTLTLVTEP